MARYSSENDKLIKFKIVDSLYREKEDFNGSGTQSYQNIAVGLGAIGMSDIIKDLAHDLSRNTNLIKTEGQTCSITIDGMRVMRQNPNDYYTMIALSKEKPQKIKTPRYSSGHGIGRNLIIGIITSVIGGIALLYAQYMGWIDQLFGMLPF